MSDTVEKLDANEADEKLDASEADDLEMNWDNEPEDDEVIEEEADEEGEPKPKPQMNVRLIAIIAVAAVLVAVAGFVGYQLIFGGGFGGKVAARVNNEKITVAQLDEELDRIKKQNPDIFAGGGMEEASIRKMLLDEMINRLLIDQEARKEGVIVNDEEVAAQVSAIKASFPDEAAYTSALEESGYTTDYLNEQIRSDLLRQGLLEKKVPTDSISAEDIKAYYEANQESFGEAAGKKASHILFDKDDKANAEKVLASLKASSDLKADFAEAAKEYSKDPGSAQNGGDLGWPNPQQPFVEEFQKAIDGLKLNQMSGLVETEYGYHIILITDEREATTKSLDEVEAQIADLLVNQKRNEAYQSLLEELHENATIKILDPAVLAYDKAQEEAAQNPEGDVQAPEGDPNAAHPEEETPPAE